MCNVCSVILHKHKQHLRASRVRCVRPLGHRWCVCCVAGCLVAFPVPLQKNKTKQGKRRLRPTLRRSVCLFVGVLCMCAFILTLDVYLLHLIDLCNGLSELLRELPELLSARGAKTHQLLLLRGKRAQHGDAMGVV